MADPIRLRDPRSGASKALRQLIDAGRSEAPGPDRLRGVAGRLGLVASAIPGASGPMAKGGAAGLGHAGVAKLGAVVLILGAGTGALAMRDRTVPVASTVVATAAVTSATGTAGRDGPVADPWCGLVPPHAPARIPVLTSVRTRSGRRT